MKRLALMIGLALAIDPFGCRRVERRSVSRVSRPASSSSAALTHYVTRRRRFVLSSVELGIIDLHMSRALDQVMTARHAELVVNGGFFDERGEPVGLVVSEGIRLSPLKPNLSGGVMAVESERATLYATEDYVDRSPRFAVQCRPRLVVGSKNNVKSDEGPRAARTALCLRDGGATLEFVVAEEGPEEPGPTLYELGAELAAGGCEEALNLDGGPSTGWASNDGPGVVFIAPRAPVRHALVVTRKG